MTEKVREPVGTGPYAIEDWEYGQKLRLARNATYWGDKPAFAKAEYQWRSEGSVRAAMITNDETDIAVSLGPEDGAEELGVPFQNNETTALRMQATEPPRSTICACARPSTTPSTARASSRRCSVASVTLRRN